jgi:uncharacterized protein
VTSVAPGILVNSGHLIENLVFTAFRRISPDIYYYKTKNAKEIDFLVRMPDQSRMLVQVCESMADPKTRKREVSSLSDAMAELDLNRGTIVTRSEEERIEDDHGIIDVVPAWRFLISLPETGSDSSSDDEH